MQAKDRKLYWKATSECLKKGTKVSCKAGHTSNVEKYMAKTQDKLKC